MGDWYHCTFAPISSPSQTQTIYLHSTSWDSLSDRSRNSLSDRSRDSLGQTIYYALFCSFVTYFVSRPFILPLCPLSFQPSRSRDVSVGTNRASKKFGREIVCN